jgi:hypothetical protein
MVAVILSMTILYCVDGHLVPLFTLNELQVLLDLTFLYTATAFCDTVVLIEGLVASINEILDVEAS